MMQRMMILLAVLGLVLPSIVSAKLYKCINDQGQVIYTDQECEGEGEELKLPASSTYTPNILPILPSNTLKDRSAEAYKTLEILAPKDDKLIISAEGSVVIGYEIKGPLLRLKGHKFGLAVDGIKLKTRGITNQVRLNDLNPGTHTVRVFVVDKNDKELISSDLASFYMKRHQNFSSPTPGQPNLNNSAIPGVFPGSNNSIPGGLGTIPGGIR